MIRWRKIRKRVSYDEIGIWIRNRRDDIINRDV